METGRDSCQRPACDPTRKYNLPNDILADHMKIGRPPKAPLTRWEWISCLGQVVDESIKPDIDSLRFVAWNGNAPGQPFHGSRDGEILEVRGHRIDNSRDIVFGSDEVVFIQFQEAILESRQAEVVIRLGRPFYFLASFDRHLTG